MRLLFVALVLCSSAWAADRTRQIGIGGSVGWNTPVLGHPFNDAAGEEHNWGLHTRYHFNSKWGVELGHSRHEFSEVATPLETTGLTALYRCAAEARFSPVTGFGLAHADFNDGQDWRSVYKLLGGFEYDVTGKVVLGLLADYQYVDGRFFGGGEYPPGANPAHVLSARVGLTWYFGCGNSCEKACGSHCKKEHKKTAPTKNQVPVATDTDEDGVSDVQDKCPGTATGVSVNAYGCAETEKAQIKLNLQFATGKSDINASYRSELQAFAEFLKAHPQTTAVIEGHTDNAGSATGNKRLSQGRAEAVKEYLIREFGIESRRLSATGFGSEQPLADNGTADGRQKNRRVVAVVSE